MRWTVWTQALHRIIANYNALQMLWQESLKVLKEAEMRSRIKSVSLSMKFFELFFQLLLAELLFKHSDDLSKALQSSHMSAAVG